MKYVSTEGAKGDTAGRRLAGLRTSMVRMGSEFDSDWELVKIKLMKEIN